MTPSDFPCRGRTESTCPPPTGGDGRGHCCRARGTCPPPTGGDGRGHCCRVWAFFSNCNCHIVTRSLYPSNERVRNYLTKHLITIPYPTDI